MRKFITEKPFYVQILTITIPIALQNLIIFGVSMMDTIMLGRLGELQLSASAQANQPSFIFQMFIFGLAGGGSVLASQFWGKGDTEQVRKVVGIVVSMAIVMSTILTVGVLLFPEPIMRIYLKDEAVIDEAIKYLRIVGFSYFFFGVSMAFTNIIRSVEIVKISVVTSLVAFVVNVFFNWVFIFGNLGAPAMGIRGAALGTLIARVADFTLVLIYMLVIDKKLKFRLKYLILRDVALFKSFIRYAFPVVTNEVTWSLAISAQAAILGKLSTEILAANSIGSVLQQLSTIIIFGVANAACVIVGKRIGSGDMDGAKRTSFTLVMWSFVLGIIATTIIILLRKQFVGIYNITEETRVMTENLLIITAIITFFVAVSSISIVGVLRGAGDTKFCMFLELIALWCVAIPLGLIGGYALNLPILAVYALLKIDEPIKAVVASIRAFRGRSFKDVTNISGASDV